MPAVLVSGTLNFLGVLLGWVAVALTLVEQLPPDMLTPPNGDPAVLELACHHRIAAGRGDGELHYGVARAGAGVDWSQVWSVLRALLFSPLLGFVLAGCFGCCRQ